MENTNKVGRSELWNEIYNIVKQIPRKDVYGDAVDAPSATTSVEKVIEKYKIKVENNDKSESPVVFWAHFRSSEGESDRIARFNDGKESHLIFDWIAEERKKLEEKMGEIYIMINCGVIR